MENDERWLCDANNEEWSGKEITYKKAFQSNANSPLADISRFIVNMLGGVQSGPSWKVWTCPGGRGQGLGTVLSGGGGGGTFFEDPVWADWQTQHDWKHYLLATSLAASKMHLKYWSQSTWQLVRSSILGNNNQYFYFANVICPLA